MINDFNFFFKSIKKQETKNFKKNKKSKRIKTKNKKKQKLEVFGSTFSKVEKFINF